MTTLYDRPIKNIMRSSNLRCQHPNGKGGFCGSKILHQTSHKIKFQRQNGYVLVKRRVCLVQARGIFSGKSDPVRLPLRFYDMLQIDPNMVSREGLHLAFERYVVVSIFSPCLVVHLVRNQLRKALLNFFLKKGCRIHKDSCTLCLFIGV